MKYEGPAYYIVRGAITYALSLEHKTAKGRSGREFEKAAILERIRYGIENNAYNNVLIKDDVAWMEMSLKAWMAAFPSLTKSEIRNCLDYLKEHDWIRTSQQSDNTWDRIYSYTLTDKYGTVQNGVVEVEAHACASGDTGQNNEAATVHVLPVAHACASGDTGGVLPVAHDARVDNKDPHGGGIDTKKIVGEEGKSRSGDRRPPTIQEITMEAVEEIYSLYPSKKGSKVAATEHIESSIKREMRDCGVDTKKAIRYLLCRASNYSAVWEGDPREVLKLGKDCSTFYGEKPFYRDTVETWQDNRLMIIAIANEKGKFPNGAIYDPETHTFEGDDATEDKPRELTAVENEMVVVLKDDLTRLFGPPKVDPAKQLLEVTAALSKASGPQRPIEAWFSAFSKFIERERRDNDRVTWNTISGQLLNKFLVEMEDI